MAKVAFTKLGLKVNQEKLVVKFNEQDIEVEQYLPINEKLGMISRIINKSADENNFANPVKLNVFTILEIIYAYTNINFTEKQKEDEIKLYDLFISSGFWYKVLDAIPGMEYGQVYGAVQECAEAIYTYRNSVLGILEAVSIDYENVNLDADVIRKKLGDSEALGLVKDVLTKLG